jgi:hypothetical protein
VYKAEIDEILEERYDSNLEKIAKGGQHAVGYGIGKRA